MGSRATRTLVLVGSVRGDGSNLFFGCVHKLISALGFNSLGYSPRSRSLATTTTHSESELQTMPQIPLRLAAYTLLIASGYLLYTHKAQDYIQSAGWPFALVLTPQPFPEPSPIEVQAPVSNGFTRHIVAVGDLHGDLGNARKVLQFSGVTDEFGDWAGGVDFFVQTGDIIDR